MLVKKELANIPVLCFPKNTEKERRNCTFTASAALQTLEKCGTILVVDIFNTKNRELRLRFFCDGTSYLVCERWPADIWLKRKPDSLLGHGNVASTKTDDELVSKFMKGSKDSWRFGYSVDSCINAFVSILYGEKQDKAMERKYAKRQEHFDMFPEYPEDLPMFCEEHVFGHTYIFVDKVEKGRKKAVCGHCGSKLTLKAGDGKPGEFGKCPKCGLLGKYRGMWIQTTPEDKSRICVAHKVDGQLLIRWVEIRRSYIGNQYKYDFYDYYRNLYLRTPNGDVIYSYAYLSIMNYCGWDWYRKKNGSTNREKTFLYTENLREVFGDSYYNVDMQSGLTGVGKITFVGLLDNLKNTPAAEYLFKMGLSTLAANLYLDDLRDGAGFTDALGVSKQYLPLYRKYNVDVYEHRVIQGSKTWVSAENIEKFRSLKPESSDAADIIDLLEQMSFERFVNYFTKQKAVRKVKLKLLLGFYKDYINMAESMKVDLSRKSVRFPRDIKESHDIILKRFNEVKHEIENENFKQAVEKLYAGMSEYKKGNFCIVFPQLRSDLLAEGQSLNHCVGAESYYKNHVEGTSMIFFVRKIEEPERSYFTMEIDMRELRIRQLYGFGGCSPSAEVRQFANEFLRRLKPNANEEDDYGKGKKRPGRIDYAGAV